MSSATFALLELLLVFALVLGWAGWQWWDWRRWRRQQAKLQREQAAAPGPGAVSETKSVSTPAVSLPAPTPHSADTDPPR